MNNDTDRYSHDLTHLSSREQLSALMDGALPEDQTRFLLRRLQHDVELTESWDCWRMAGEVMRGVTPAQRLPSDFASKVSAALKGEAHAAPLSPRQPKRLPVWVHWSGGAAVAAALALVAVMVRPAADVAPPPAQVAQAAPAAPVHPEKAPVPQAPAPAALADSSEVLAAAAAVAERPARRAASRTSPREVATPVPAVLQEAPQQFAKAEIAAPVASAAHTASANDDIVTKPWPRSALPQFGNSGSMAVGFGNGQPHTTRSNPFIPPIFAAPPKLLSEPAQAEPSEPQPQQP